jgi:hypothetical protein
MPNTIAGKAVKPYVKRLRIPSTNAAIAKPLALGTIPPDGTGGGDNCTPQDRHIPASSGFSVPHLGQYIFILPSTKTLIGSAIPRLALGK